MDNRCCICHGEKPEALKFLKANGLQTMVDAAVEGSNTLPPEIHAGAGYHNSCRSKKIRELKKKSEEVKPRTSHRHKFHIRLDCLYCERTLKMFNKADQGLSDQEKRVDWVHPRSKDLTSKVETDGPNSFEETLHRKITERLEKNPDDTWALEVLGRISSVSLRATDAIYHKGCAARFRTGRKKPGESTHNVGAPKDIVRRLIFDQTFADMQEENKDDGGMQISEIYERMEQRVRGTEHDPFSIRSIGRILEEDDYKEIVTVVRGFALFQERD